MDLSRSSRRLASVDKRVHAARSLRNPLCDIVTSSNAIATEYLANDAGSVSLLHPLSADPVSFLPLCCKFYRFESLPVELFEWMFRLTETNMKELYTNSAWGWNGPAKRTEMSDKHSCYLCLFDGSQRQPSSSCDSPTMPCAFAHFQFDADYGREVLYCYELQIPVEYQRKNLGKLLMMLLEIIAWNCSLGHVVLTCLKQNTSSMLFYEKLGYRLDETNATDQENVCYTILSKSTRRKPDKAIEYIAERLSGCSLASTHRR